MYLHEDREVFRALIINSAQHAGVENVIVEKDYYVTLILKLLAETYENCVFKGGTSLSKGFHLIDRFSEDIDITFEEHLGSKKRKRLKHETLKAISEELALPIENWNETESNKDLNAYFFQYHTVFQNDPNILSEAIPEYVKVEISLGSTAFPTKICSIGSYVGEYLAYRNREDLTEMFHLGEFKMKLQSIERTYIDKIFASCDYYINGLANRRSRHLYDIYKMTPYITFDSDFYSLFEKVCIHRREMNERESRKGRKLICPSAESDVSLAEVIRSYCEDEFYRQDYREITDHFIHEKILYEDILMQMLKIAEMIP